MEFGRLSLGQPPPSPFTPGSRYPRNGMIMGSEPATVPPSPSLPVPGFDALSMTPVSAPASTPAASSKRKGRNGQENRKHNAQTGAGIRKTQPKKKIASDTFAKLIDA